MERSEIAVVHHDVDEVSEEIKAFKLLARQSDSSKVFMIFSAFIPSDYLPSIIEDAYRISRLTLKACGFKEVISEKEFDARFMQD